MAREQPRHMYLCPPVRSIDKSDHSSDGEDPNPSRSSIPVWNTEEQKELDLGEAVNSLCDRIAPMYAEIASMILNPQMESGTSRTTLHKIWLVRNLLTTLEHLATAGFENKQSSI